MADEEPVIGILSGMGPYAGLDLAAKIHTLTDARTDQEHLSVALVSLPNRIPDRSAFLFDRKKPNPVPPLTAAARRLEATGATVAGMPCNTAHAPPIFDALRAELHASGSTLRLVHMIEETARHVKEQQPHLARVGVLSTEAVRRLHLYRNAFEEAGLQAIHPHEKVQREAVTPVIFDPDYGIKARSAPVTDRARRDLLRAIEHLRENGAEAVILGCTELPLALPEPRVDGLPLIDPTTILARTLIRETHPDRIRAKR